MKSSKSICCVIFILLISRNLNANEVVKKVPGNSVGQVIGGWFLIGGAVDRPTGAIVGGLAGTYASGEAQESTGKRLNSYLVQSDQGILVLMRSPNHVFQLVDKVVIEGIRALPVKGIDKNVIS